MKLCGFRGSWCYFLTPAVRSVSKSNSWAQIITTFTLDACQAPYSTHIETDVNHLVLG